MAVQFEVIHLGNGHLLYLPTHPFLQRVTLLELRLTNRRLWKAYQAYREHLKQKAAPESTVPENSLSAS